MLNKLRSRIESLFSEVEQQGAEDAHSLELATAALLLEISLADACSQPEEISLIRKLVHKGFDLEEKEVDELLSLAQTERDNAASIYEFTHLLNERLNRRQKVDILEKLWQVAFVDQVMDKYEEYYIRKISELLHVSHVDYLKAKHRAAGQLVSATKQTPVIDH